jgi:hypothetical protein
MPKRFPSFRRLAWILLSLSLVLSALQLSPVRAADQRRIDVSAINTTGYPQVSFAFWPFDTDGNFITTVSTSGLHVFENDTEVKVTDLQMIEPGAHIVLAVNEGSTLGNSYAGKTRFASMMEVWTAWAADQSITTVDDFTLVNNDSTVADQLTTPSQWVDAIAAYNPDFKAATANMNCLTLALDKLSTFTDAKTKVLFLITPLPGKNQLTALLDMAANVVKEDVSLYIWLVGPQSFKSEEGTSVLLQMAQATGGSLLIFSGAETLPSIASYLEPLRFEYQAVYTTSLRESGTYTVAVQIDQTDFQGSSEKVNFDLKALAPNPILLAPPSTITRTWEQDSDTKKWSLVPTLQTIDFILEFPDGHTRLLKSAKLIVDGNAVAENTAEPFTEFKWDLTPYTESGTHMIRVAVVDVAGLTASTIELPVSITVKDKPLGVIGRFFKEIDPQTFGVVAFLVLVAAGLIYLFLKLRLRAPAAKSGKRSARQTIPTGEANAGPTDTRPQSRGEPPARLRYLGGGESDLPKETVIEMTYKGLLIGSDSAHCGIAFAAPTLSPVHAEIFVDSAKNFLIADRGSAAGTWVNYDPASSQGTRLENGDIIHLGACDFRFEITGAKAKPILVQPTGKE